MASLVYTYGSAQQPYRWTFTTNPLPEFASTGAAAISSVPPGGSVPPASAAPACLVIGAAGSTTKATLRTGLKVRLSSCVRGKAKLQLRRGKHVVAARTVKLRVGKAWTGRLTARAPAGTYVLRLTVAGLTLDTPLTVTRRASHGHSVRSSSQPAGSRR